MKWSKIKVMEARPEQPDTFFFKYEYDQEDFSALKLNKKKGHPINPKTYVPPRAYNAPIPLKSLKKKHIRELCMSGANTEKYHPFYDQFLDSPISTLAIDVEQNPQDVTERSGSPSVI